MKIVVGISGATGVIYGVRILQELHKAQVETHLVISRWAEETLRIETGYSMQHVCTLSSHVHKIDNLAAVISSGSFLHDGMVVAPCSMKTLSAISNGYTDNLLSRAADVTLKERRKLILLVRETPLNAIHLENMLKLAKLGVIITPPVPAFYNAPVTIDDIVDHTIFRVLDNLGVKNDYKGRWNGTGDALDPCYYGNSSILQS